MAPTSHAYLPASSSDRWLNCPGSIRLCKDIPRTENQYAEEGTAAHMLGEWCLRDDYNAIAKLGKTIMRCTTVTGKEWWTVTEEMAEAVQVYLDFVRSTVASLPGAKLLVEHKFGLDWLIPGKMGGTNDSNAFQPYGKMVVVDYKHGQGVLVDAENNPQIMYYGLGALGKDNVNCVEDIELVIVQPRGQGGDPIKRWSISPDQLYAWANDVLLPGAKLALTDDAPLHAGDHCRFCPAAATCPALRKHNLEAAQVAFTPTDLMPVNVKPSLPAPESLTTEQLERVYIASDIISEWATAACAELKSRIERGDASTRFKIVSGRSYRSWADEAVALEALKQHIDPWKSDMVSPTQAEDRMKDRNIPKQERESIVALLVKKTAGRSMAPIEDKRPALTPGGNPFTVIDIQAEVVEGKW